MLNNLSAKNKTLIFVILTLVLFACILIGTIYINQKNKLENLEKQYYYNIKNSYQKILEKHKAFYEFRLKANIDSKGVKEAFYKRDREELLALVEGRWKVLTKENPYLKIMHFHLPNGESFLRVHKQEKFGDNIAQKRAMAAAMHKKKKPLYGFEAGIYMLAYREFIPVFYKNSYIGAVELGSRPDQILHEMNYYNNIKGVLFVKDDMITEYKEKSDFKIGQYKLQYSSLENDTLLQQFAKTNHLDKDSTFEKDGKHYAVYIFSLNDFQGKPSVKAVFFHDITEMKTAFEDTIKQLLFLIIGLVGLIVIVINLGFKGIIEKLEKTNIDLDKNKIFTNSILHNSAHAIITTDNKGVITSFNKKAEILLGYKSSELVNKQTPEIFHKKSEVKQRAEEFSKELDVEIQPGFEVFIAKTEYGIENNDEWIYITKDEKEIPVSLHITKLTNKDGTLIGYLGMAEDISYQKELREEEQKAKDSLNDAQKIAHLGSWTLDHTSNHLTWSDEIYNIFEIDQDKFEPSYEGFLNAIHPEDLEMVNEAFSRSVEHGESYKIEHRLKMTDGRIKYVVENGFTKYNEDNEPLISQGTVQDITELKKLERKSLRYLDLIDKNIITSSTDLSGKIIEVSQAFCDISGYTKRELLGQNHNMVRHPDVSKEIYEDLWTTIKANKVWQGEIKNRKKDGSYYWVDATISPSIDDDGNKIGYTAIRQDITDKKNIELISITDGLTNIYNRRHFNELFPKIINSAKRNNDLVSFLILDIDHFKQYNDTYGHQMGDDVLVKVANAIQNSLKRSDDICFRLGGEEFGVIFQVDSTEKAKEFANTIRENIESLHIEHSGNSASSYVTASMGLICKNANEINSDDEVYKQGDDLLYKAKKSGRNKVCDN